MTPDNPQERLRALIEEMRAGLEEVPDDERRWLHGSAQNIRLLLDAATEGR